MTTPKQGLRYLPREDGNKKPGLAIHHKTYLHFIDADWCKRQKERAMRRQGVLGYLQSAPGMKDAMTVEGMRRHITYLFQDEGTWYKAMQEIHMRKSIKRLRWHMYMKKQQFFQWAASKIINLSPDPSRTVYA